jgi:hypothetical protein
MITEKSLFSTRVDASIQLLQSKPTNELSFIKITVIFLNIKSHMFRVLVTRQQGETKLHKTVA